MSKSDTTTPHPSKIIREEMKARGWNRDTLAMRMGPEWPTNRLSLDLYFEVGPLRTNMVIGAQSAKKFAKAFDMTPEFFMNLCTAWRKGQTDAKT